MIFRSKATELITALNAECDSLRTELARERQQRVMAETIAADRLRELTASEERALRFEKLYAEATTERLKSLDTVNGVLLRGMAPEAPQMKEAGPAPDGKQVDISPPRRQSQLQKAAGKHIEAALKKIATAAPKPVQ